jgi:hypothetical protein
MVAHLDAPIESLEQPIRELVACSKFNDFYLCEPVFTMIASCYFPPKHGRQFLSYRKGQNASECRHESETHLQAIANAQDGNAKIEYMRINMRCIAVVYRVRRPREDDSYGRFEAEACECESTASRASSDCLWVSRIDL